MFIFIVTDSKIDFLFPSFEDDWLAKSNLARFAVEVIDGLGLCKLTWGKVKSQTRAAQRHVCEKAEMIRQSNYRQRGMPGAIS